jgi:transcriptional regulator with XRE-family HTH domain
MLWGAFDARRKSEGFRFQDLADATGTNKGQVSRWFSGLPNWTLNTISDIAEALDLEIEVRARHRVKGHVYLPNAVLQPKATTKIRTDDDNNIVRYKNRPSAQTYSETDFDSLKVLVG